jgi:hypothetical protein
MGCLGVVIGGSSHSQISGTVSQSAQSGTFLCVALLVVDQSTKASFPQTKHVHRHAELIRNAGHGMRIVSDHVSSSGLVG